jgi:hypothetical protein
MDCYERIPARVKAIQWAPGETPEIDERVNSDGIFHYFCASQGRFMIYPGDWMLQLGDRIWICEASEFPELYRKVPDGESPQAG